MRVPSKNALASHLVLGAAVRTRASPLPAWSRRQSRVASTNSDPFLLSTHARHDALRANSTALKRRYPTQRDDTVTVAPDSGSNLDKKTTLDEELWAYYNSTRPTTRELRARREALMFVQRIFDAYAKIHRFDRLRNVVEMFGSIRSGLDKGGSDLDLTIADPRLPSGLRPGVYMRDLKKLPFYSVKAVAEFFEKHPFNQLTSVPKARVPIVSATVPSEPPIAFDLSFNKLEGTFSARLLASYVALNDKIAPLVVFLKTWVDRRGLYKIVTKKRNKLHVRRPINGHTIALMVVAYMQTLRMLPNLQQPFVAPLPEVAPQDINLDLAAAAPAQRLDLPDVSHGCDTADAWWYSPNKDGVWRVPMDTRFVPASTPAVQDWLKAHREAGVQEPTLAELLEGFFKFYARFPWDKFAVSVRDGGVIHREQRRRVPGLDEELDALPLRKQLRQYTLRQDVPAALVEPAARLLLRKIPDLPPPRAVPVLVIEPFTGSWLRFTTRATTRADRFDFELACRKAANSIAKGARLGDLLKPTDKKTATPLGRVDEGDIPSSEKTSVRTRSRDRERTVTLDNAP